MQVIDIIGCVLLCIVGILLITIGVCLVLFLIHVIKETKQ